MDYDGEAMAFIRNLDDIARENKINSRGSGPKFKRPKIKRTPKKHRRTRLPKG